MVANLTAKDIKTIINGESVKQCLGDTADTICPDRNQGFSKVSLSRQTVSR